MLVLHVLDELTFQYQNWALERLACACSSNMHRSDLAWGVVKFTGEFSQLCLANENKRFSGMLTIKLQYNDIYYRKSVNQPF